MRIPDDLLTAPVFLGGRDRGGQLHYRATAFLSTVPSPSGRPQGIGWLCLVTARHNVLAAEREYGNVWVRMNTKTGGALDIEIKEPWVYPTDPASDVAALPFFPDVDFESLPLPARWFVTEDVIRQRNVGVGEDLIIMGLFANHVGAQRNLPIVRSGSIASMPSEPLIDEASGEPYRAYLAEVRSIGGLSGSPVLVALNPATRLDLETPLLDVAGQHFYLLGLIRGHWDRDVESDFGETEFGRLNTGIAVVTPITDLLPLFEADEFVAYVKKMDERYSKSEGEMVEDFGPEEASNPEFARFEDLAAKILQVPKAEIDEKRRED